VTFTDKAPSFRQAFAKRRCLIPADGFREWRKTAKAKLPFAVAMKRWPTVYLLLDSGTTGRIPNEVVAQIHPRMPVILPEKHHAAWLGETENGNLKESPVPYPADQMRMWEIFTKDQ
jgi:putative SOS response-associated peptidase YedK